ncbi:hypothetical protein E8E12_000889 [Didymella heteroderae]|uniref:LDB19 N-terminal domain-containing protein n=1 Tax=Didymella heteroderae TaxID=1769908 RepID=A0A9P4WFW9_9PLEO|nr:hypothetical protein E8E12_000889 [Didymella heteroderae]
MNVESPPVVLYNSPQNSAGAILTGQLLLNVREPHVTIEEFGMKLLAIVTTKKPLVRHCDDCTSQTTTIHRWDFLIRPTALRYGQHIYPFSHLLPGHLPATTHGRLATLDYCLSAVATASKGDKITYQRAVDIRRAILPGDEKHSIRLFPPTNLTALAKLPSVIHSNGEIGIEMRLSGTVQNKADLQTRWRLWKLNWRIEETQRSIAPACSRHSSKVIGGGRDICHKDVRVIARGVVKSDWKTDFERGEIDVAFNAACNVALKPLCDMACQTGMSVKHSLVVEMVVAKERASLQKLSQATATGVACVLCTQFHLVLTERPGMGIAWVEEQPPIYEDVPAGPPAYTRRCRASDFYS